MGQVTQVTIPAQETGPEAPAQTTAPEVQVPDKFKNADGTVNVEALAKSYVEMERLLGGRSQGKTPTDKDGIPTDTKPGQQTQQQQQQTRDADDQSPLAVKAAAEEALAGQGLDMDEFVREYQANGGLSAESYEKLESKGFPKSLVDQFIEGQVALRTSELHQVYAVVGGEQGYQKLAAWMAKNLPPADLEVYNEIVSTGGVRQAILAVEGMKARYEAANGKNPNLVFGGGSQPTAQPFASHQAMVEAMKDPRYKIDPAYRAEVAERVRVSNW